MLCALPTLLSLLNRRGYRFLCYGALMLAMASATWRKWPDLMIDFGRELYTPWRLSQGAVLSRDVATLFGPLSQWFNGLLFSLFGASFTTLIAANLLLLTLLVAVVDAFFVAAAGVFSAWAAATVFLTVFAFGQYTYVGNYNFIAPYAHEATHGVILGTITVWLLARFLAEPRAVSLVGAGLCLGLVQLTKPEVALATLVATLAAFVLAVRARSLTARLLTLFIGAAAAPVVLTFGLFLRVLPPMGAFRATLGAWYSIPAGAASGNYYRASLGIDEPGTNLFRMLVACGALLVIGGVALLADWLSRRAAGRTWIAVALAVGLALVLNTQLLAGPWGEIGRALPVTTAALFVWFAVRAWRSRDPRAGAAAVWAAFSLGLLGKILLNSRLYHYGFSLAMPATLLLVVACVEWLPASLAWTTRPSIARGAGVAFILSLVVVHLRWSAELLAPKDFVMGQGGDSFVVHSPETSPRTAIVLRAIDRIQALLPPNGTVAVFPEGIMLNYLTRRQAPTAYVNFMPPELAAFGEQAILEAHRRAPPDLVVLVQKDTAEYGVGPFGRDPNYGARLMSWIRANYRPVETIGKDPAAGDAYGIQILRRR
jgi:hypothetical protein